MKWRKVVVPALAMAMVGAATAVSVTQALAEEGASSGYALTVKITNHTAFVADACVHPLVASGSDRGCVSLNGIPVGGTKESTLKNQPESSGFDLSVFPTGAATDRGARKRNLRFSMKWTETRCFEYSEIGKGVNPGGAVNPGGDVNPGAVKTSDIELREIACPGLPSLEEQRAKAKPKPKPAPTQSPSDSAEKKPVTVTIKIINEAAFTGMACVHGLEKEKYCWPENLPDQTDHVNNGQSMKHTFTGVAPGTRFDVEGWAVLGRAKTIKDLVVGEKDETRCFRFNGTTIIGFKFYESTNCEN